MKYHVLTLFPDMVMSGLSESILGRAIERGIISADAVDIRDYTLDKHGKVDDYTYGGGAGMLMQAQPVYDAYMSVTGGKKVRTIYVTPQGYTFDQKMATDFAKEEELVFLCGHYEGIDERVLEEIVTDFVSIGDYVLTGGELPAMVMIDAISRLVPGVLNNETSAVAESFHRDLLEYPQYSRPEVWHDKCVPKVLLSGNHLDIEKWRMEKSVERTKNRRPDLYAKYQERQSAIDRLLKKKRNNIHIVESLKRGDGELLFSLKSSYVVYNRKANLCIIKMPDLDLIDSIIDILPDSVANYEISPKEAVKPLMERLDLTNESECLNYCYTNNNPLPVRCKDIRQLDKSALEYIKAHYEECDEAYILERLNLGEIYGAYIDNTLVGFIGTHDDGSIGMLYVDEDCRNKGIGNSLESFMINQHRLNNFIPFGQVHCDNNESKLLQKKLGLYVSDEIITWVC